jgi:hypothetical protein
MIQASWLMNLRDKDRLSVLGGAAFVAITLQPSGPSLPASLRFLHAVALEPAI